MDDDTIYINYNQLPKDLINYLDITYPNKHVIIDYHPLLTRLQSSLETIPIELQNQILRSNIESSRFLSKQTTKKFKEDILQNECTKDITYSEKTTYFKNYKHVTAFLELEDDIIDGEYLTSIRIRELYIGKVHTRETISYITCTDNKYVEVYTRVSQHKNIEPIGPDEQFDVLSEYKIRSNRKMCIELDPNYAESKLVDYYNNLPIEFDFERDVFIAISLILIHNTNELEFREYYFDNENDKLIIKTLYHKHKLKLLGQIIELTGAILNNNRLGLP